MLECFLQSLSTSSNPQLIKRIKTAVFDKLIENNGPETVDEEEPKEFYFSCFDIVPFAEKKIFTAASDASTRDANRDILYSLYDRAIGTPYKYQDQNQ